MLRDKISPLYPFLDGYFKLAFKVIALKIYEKDFVRTFFNIHFNYFLALFLTC